MNTDGGGYNADELVHDELLQFHSNDHSENKKLKITIYHHHEPRVFTHSLIFYSLCFISSAASQMIPPAATVITWSRWRVEFWILIGCQVLTNSL